MFSGFLWSPSCLILKFYPRVSSCLSIALVCFSSRCFSIPSLTCPPFLLLFLIPTLVVSVFNLCFPSYFCQFVLSSPVLSMLLHLFLDCFVFPVFLLVSMAILGWPHWPPLWPPQIWLVVGQVCQHKKQEKCCQSLFTQLALFTQRLHIISGAVVRQFSSDGDSHRAKHLFLQVCNSHRKLALRLLKRRDITHHVNDVGAFPRCSPVNLNPWTVYNHMDAVIMCSDWDPQPTNILESDRVKFFALNHIIIYNWHNGRSFSKSSV